MMEPSFYLLLFSAVCLVAAGILALGLRRNRQKQFIYMSPTLSRLKKEDDKNPPIIDEDLLPDPPLGLDDPKVTEVNVKPKAPAQTEQLMVLYVMAQPGHLLMGYELLQALLALGLRYGDLQIFHCYDVDKGHIKSLFSIASATEPGTFDLNNIGGFSCRGLCLFMTPSRLEEPLNAFQSMLNTAEQLAVELNAVVQDDQRQDLTEEALMRYQDRLLTQ